MKICKLLSIVDLKNNKPNSNLLGLVIPHYITDGAVRVINLDALIRRAVKVILYLITDGFQKTVKAKTCFELFPFISI